MANFLRVPDTNSYITWRKDSGDKLLYLTLHEKDDKPIAKAKLTADQLHRYICMNNTMK